MALVLLPLHPCDPCIMWSLVQVWTLPGPSTGVQESSQSTEGEESESDMTLLAHICK